MVQPHSNQTVQVKAEFKVYEPPNRILAEYQPAREPRTVAEYFCLKNPEHARRYGPPVLEAVFTESGLKRSQPIHLNEDFFCGVLGSDRRIGHHLVFYLPDQTFYFYDSRFDYYCRTSEEKVMLLLSQILIHAAEAMESRANVSSLVIELRDEMKLKQIVRRSRAMLAVDESFFEGEHGRKRKVGGHVYDPKQEPPQKLFIREAIVPAPDRVLSLNEAYGGYSEFCRTRGFSSVDRKFFKSLISEMLREEFGVGVRRDLKDSNGKYIQGWKGIACRYTIESNN